MPATWTISHDERHVSVRLHGTIGLKDIETYLDDVVVSGAMTYTKLLDATDAVSGLSDDDMMALGARVSAYAVMDPRGPVAIVAGESTALEAASRFLNLGGAKRPGKVFRSNEEAMQWLKANALPS